MPKIPENAQALSTKRSQVLCCTWQFSYTGNTNGRMALSKLLSTRGTVIVALSMLVRISCISVSTVSRLPILVREVLTCLVESRTSY